MYSAECKIYGKLAISDTHPLDTMLTVSDVVQNKRLARLYELQEILLGVEGKISTELDIETLDTDVDERINQKYSCRPTSSPISSRTDRNSLDNGRLKCAWMQLPFRVF